MMGIVGRELYHSAVDAHWPSRLPEKILMALHGAGRSYGSTRADFTHRGRLYVRDAARHDGHRALCQSSAEARS